MNTGHLVRAVDTESAQLLVGVVDVQGLAPLRAHTTISDLLRLPLDSIRLALAETGPMVPWSRLRTLPPVDGAMEVWAAGVTYELSRSARIEESSEREVYRKVYDAERPELFFKGPAWRMVTDGEPIGVRSDSANSVPEPEVGIVLNSMGELVGFTVVNDVSSRTIEGENPLYLSQAKIFDGCCAVGPTIAPRWLIEDERSMTIHMTITRRGNPVFEGGASTGQLKRGFEDLADYLFRELSFPGGVVLSTGTSVVPPLDSTLSAGDMVEITVEGSVVRLVRCSLQTRSGAGYGPGGPIRSSFTRTDRETYDPGSNQGQ